MTEQVASYRRILRTSSIIGGASTINIIIGVLRIKVLAILLGPAGLGLVSLFTGVMGTASAVASLGIGTVGTRQVAEANAQDNAHALAVTRRAMFWGMLLLAIAGASVVWTFREVLAARILGSREYSVTVGWLALGVAFSVVGASQGALIQGMRRIGDLARLSVYGSILNTVLGIALIWRWGSAALWAYVIIGPVISFLLGYLYVSRLPKIHSDRALFQEITEQWRILIRLGVPFVGAGLVQSLVSLWIRVSVNHTLGVDALGHFQAAWAISMQYVGFVLAAMGADYYPRLAGVVGDKIAASRLVNEQTEVALLLSAPIFIAMMGLAPWVIDLLYTPAFAAAVEVLRWQILGDVLKVASWPLGFIILAAGAGKTFFWTETSCLLLMGTLIAVFAPIVGLQITGIGFLACYVVYLPLVYFLARRRIQFAWSGMVVRLLTLTFGLTAVVALISTYTRWGALLAMIFAAALSIYTFGRLTDMSDIGGLAGRIGSLARKMTQKSGEKHD
jgi:O-antigen/teichoic acid export membrane protein